MSDSPRSTDRVVLDVDVDVARGCSPSVRVDTKNARKRLFSCTFPRKKRVFPRKTRRASVASPSRDARMTRDDDDAPKAFVASACAVACATSLTHPMDALKTLTQASRPSSAIGARVAGVSVLFAGLTPALVRAMTYGGARLGLYDVIRARLRARAFVDARESSLTLDIVAGFASGAIAAFVLNPTELVKVRMMVRARDGEARMRALDVVARSVKEGGLRSLWRGCALASARSGALTASQCATYGEVKKRLIANDVVSDGLTAHVAASMSTGIVATAATNPIDMVKTRVYIANAGDGQGKSRVSAMACAREVVVEQGVRGFFRGFWANYLRLGPQTVVTFVVSEHLRALMGARAL